MLMSAHVVFPALDPNRPATLSRRILRDLLRGELGFDGVLVSDALEMKAIADRYGEAAGARIALAAGADQVIVAVPDLETTLTCRDEVLGALRTGSCPRSAYGRQRGASGGSPGGTRPRPTPARHRLGLRGGPGGGTPRRGRPVRAAPRARGPRRRPVPAAAPRAQLGRRGPVTQLRAVDPTVSGTAVTGEPADPAALVDGILRWAKDRR